MPETVTARKIVDHVFCPEASRLAQLGHEAANQSQWDAGTAHHAHKATAEHMPGGLIAVGCVILILALIALVLLWTLNR